MSRAVRITVGSVLVGVLAFVALVAGVMAASSGFDGDPFGLSTAGVDTPVTAEVLDVDDYGDGWPTVDVRWTTPDGEVVVTYVDWEWSDDLPSVGDRVDVVYDALDPEYAFAADDPFLRGGGSEDAGPVDGEDAAASDGETQGGSGRVAGWVSLAALLGVVVGAVITVVAAVRAPSPAGDAHQPGVYEAPHPHLAGVGAPPYVTQPYPQQQVPPPYAPQPHVQPYPPPHAQQPAQQYGQPPSPPQQHGPRTVVPHQAPQSHETTVAPSTGQQWPQPG